MTLPSYRRVITRRAGNTSVSDRTPGQPLADDQFINLLPCERAIELVDRSNQDIPAVLARIEWKLDKLIAALAEDDDEQEPERTLDGDETDGERDQGQSLG